MNSKEQLQRLRVIAHNGLKMAYIKCDADLAEYFQSMLDLYLEMDEFDEEMAQQEINITVEGWRYRKEAVCEIIKNMNAEVAEVQPIIIRPTLTIWQKFLTLIMEILK